MTKISDLSALTGAGVDAAADLITVADMSETGVARNKKMTFAQLTIAVGGGYTDESARDAIAAMLAAGTHKSITVTNDDAGNLMSLAVTPAVQSVTSSATVTPTFSDDLVKITAQAAGLTLANPTGTAIPGWGMAIRIKDNGTARSIAYGTQYRAIGVTLPTTTVISKTLYLGLIYNSDDTKWDVVAVAQEA